MDGPSELDEFREQWKQEVHRAKSVPLPADSPFATPPSSPPLKPTTKKEELVVLADNMNKEDDTSTSSASTVAIDVYRLAIEMERKGQLGQALLHYRKAFKLDPDIDKTYRQLELVEQAAVAAAANNNNNNNNNTLCSSSFNYPRQCDPLVAAATADGRDIRALLGHSHHEYTPSTVVTGKSIDPLDSLIREFIQQDLSYIPKVDYKPISIAKLPDEMLVQVLGHLVVYSISSMPAFALVCKRFFLATRSASLWRHACEHVFRAPTMSLEQSRQYQAEFVRTLYDGYWLRMFIERPRLRFDGVYISVCQYIRPGRSETAWTQPVHLVTYYRYLRFFPDGRIIKYLSTDEPTDVVRLLTPDFSRRQVFHGRFSLEDESGGQVAIDMRDKTRPRDRFQMMLFIKSTSRGRHNKLGWLSYSSKKDGREEGTTYDLNMMRPYFFSVVRSYRKQL
ncbi:hypothetical protein BDA99DRAFT_522987 [Phascolomyces articulosus]|uniref:F-box domain-containing protein n=1 Tax=Phascolomyces articulosus TaxID=60185 RepID=A0AAD5JQR9_9FUNG|nr:hypothetical protein BDA99DRAFT_522987 [Phascolomyces articulosus]